MKELENFFFVFCSNMAKNVVSGHFSTPWASPFTQNLVFVDIVERTSGDTYWVFLSLYVTIRKFVFCFFLNMQKIGQLPHFRPPWGVNLIPTQNFCVAFHKVGCLNIIFIVKYYLDIEMIYRETNILKFEK